MPRRGEFVDHLPQRVMAGEHVEHRPLVLEVLLDAGQHAVVRAELLDRGTEAGGLQVAVHHVAEAAIDSRVEASRRLRVELLQARVAVDRDRRRPAECRGRARRARPCRSRTRGSAGSARRPCPSRTARRAHRTWPWPPLNDREKRLNSRSKTAIRPRRAEQASRHARDTTRRRQADRPPASAAAPWTAAARPGCSGAIAVSLTERQPATAPGHSSSPG